jgi:hypothetical protein
VSGQADPDRLPADAGDPKAVVGRLIDEVINAGHLDIIDAIYTPQMAPAARRWITPFRVSFPDAHANGSSASPASRAGPESHR